MLRGTKQKGFTIVELLTVMSIIIILMSILVPALSRVRRYAKVVTQKGQFSDISKGLEIYRNEHQESFPDSGAVDSATPAVGYCGAMKLCEALLGQDGMGYHPLSRNRADGTGLDPAGIPFNLYPFDLCVTLEPSDPAYPPLVPNLQERVKYVDPENIRAVRLRNLYPAAWNFAAGVSFYNPTAFDDTLPNAVFTDVFLRASIQGGAWPQGCPDRAGQKVGMPILYYKSDPAKLNHDTITPLIPANPNTNIYNFDDNRAITALGCPWEADNTVNPHPMFTEPRVFLKAITNARVTSTPKPHNEDGYILMSAGFDGLYGTKDDVFNFAD